MKTWIVLIALVLFRGLLYAEPAAPVIEKKDEPKSLCPVTKMADNCLNCHALIRANGQTKWGLKEVDPNGRFDYPLAAMRWEFDQVGEPTKLILALSSIDDEPVAKAFQYSERHNVKRLVLDILSPGGSLFLAYHIAGLMQAYQARGWIVETRVHGFAASAGFYIAANGTKGYRFVAPSAELMWHELSSFKLFSIETPASSEEGARIMRHLQDTANTRLAQVSKLSKEKIDELIKNKEFWMTGKQALEYGFADCALQ